jgi:hypothetical protein
MEILVMKRAAVVLLSSVRLLANLTGCSEADLKSAAETAGKAAASGAVRAAGEAISAQIEGKLVDGKLSVQEAERIIGSYQGVLDVSIKDVDNDGFVDGGIEIRVKDAVACVRLGAEKPTVENKPC